MPKPLASLATSIPTAKIEKSIHGVMAQLGASSTIWKPLSPVRPFIKGVALMMSALSSLMAAITKSGFLDLAEGDWLTWLAHYTFGVTRFEAAFAPGEVTLTNSGGGLYNVDPGDLIVSNEVTDATYRNVSAFVLRPLQTITIGIVAVEAGSSSSAQAGEITKIETALLGVTCNNAKAVLGVDPESDPALRLRCREKLGALSGCGPRDAYAFAAKGARRLDGSLIGVTRVRTIADGNGGVAVYVATASGGIAGDAADPATDLGSVAVAIDANATPPGITAFTRTAIAKEIPISYEIWTSGDLSESAIQEAIAAELARFMAAQHIGGTVLGGGGAIYADTIKAAILRAHLPDGGHLDALKIAVTSPAIEVITTPLVGDPVLGVKLTFAEVPVLGAVTGVVHVLEAAA